MTRALLVLLLLGLLACGGVGVSVGNDCPPDGGNGGDGGAAGEAGAGGEGGCESQ